MQSFDFNLKYENALPKHCYYSTKLKTFSFLFKTLEWIRTWLQHDSLNISQYTGNHNIICQQKSSGRHQPESLLPKLIWFTQANRAVPKIVALTASQGHIVTKHQQRALLTMSIWKIVHIYENIPCCHCSSSAQTFIWMYYLMKHDMTQLNMDNYFIMCNKNQ